MRPRAQRIEKVSAVLAGRAMIQLSDEGLDPWFQVLAVPRRNPSLARTLAQAIGTEWGAGPWRLGNPARGRPVRAAPYPDNEG